MFNILNAFLTAVAIFCAVVILLPACVYLWTRWRCNINEVELESEDE